MSVSTPRDENQMREQAWDKARDLSIDQLKERIDDLEALEQRLREKRDRLQARLNNLIWQLPGNALDDVDLDENGPETLRTVIEEKLGIESAETWDQISDERDQLRSRHTSVCVRGTALQKQLVLRLEQFGAETAPPAWDDLAPEYFDSLPVVDALEDQIER